MNALIAIGILLLGLFAMSYFTKRRFGVLGLALCAGSLLSASWAATLTPLIEGRGIVLVSPPLSAVVASALILLPSVLLLFRGPSYHKPLPRIAGSAMFALLALVFLLEPLSVALLTDSFSAQVLATLTKYHDLIVIAGVAMALVDILTTHAPGRGKAKPEH